ncbi:MAG: hypothetical protein ABL914_02215 [Novosphingobium sp.]
MAAIIFGLLLVPVAAGAMVLAIDRFFPEAKAAEVPDTPPLQE